MEEARPHRRDGAVDARQQRSFPLVVAESAREFQTAPGGFIQHQVRFGPVARQARDVAEARFQRRFEVDDERPGCGEAGLAIFETEARERVNVELVAQGFDRRRRVERPARPRRDRLRHSPREVRLNRLDGLFRKQALGHVQPPEFLGELTLGHVHRGEGPGREVEPSETEVTGLRAHHGGEVVGPARVEEFVFGHAAERDDAGHFPTDDFLAVVGGFHLLGDGDAVPRREQLPELVIELGEREPGHRVLLALGQREAADLVADFGIFVEEFVELAVLKQHDHAGVGILRGAELLHHRGHGGKIVRGCVGVDRIAPGV